MSAQPESIEATPRGFRPLRWLLLGVAVIVLLVVLLVAWLLGTQSGVRNALNVLQRISPDTVVVEEVTGRLLGPLQLSNVQLELPGLEGEIANIKLEWQPSQLFSRVVTIDELTLSGVSIKLLPTQDEETTEAFELPESLKAPLDVQLKDVQLADVLLQSGDAQIQIDTLAASASWIKTQLQVSQLVAHGPLFDVEANADVDARNSYPLSVNATLAGRLADYAPLGAELKITGDVDAAVLSLDVAEPYDLSVAATLTEVIENLQIDANVAASPQELASLSATLPAIKPTLTASVSGSLDNLKFEADSALAYGGEDYALKVLGTGKSTGLSVSSLVLDTGAGGLQGNAALDWSDQFSAAVALDGKNIDPAIYVADLSGALDLRVRMDMAQSSSGELTANLSDLLIEGELLELPVNATGVASMSGDTITAKNIAIQLGDNNLTINGSIGRQSDFGWSLALDDVSQFSRLAGLSLAGAVSGNGSYEGGVGNPVVDAEVNTRDLVIDGQIIDTFEFVLNGTRRDHWFSLLVEVPRADLELTGAGDLRSNNQWRYELDELWITHADLNPDSAYHEWLLQEPAGGLVSAEEIRVRPLCLQHRIPSNGGAACVSASKEQTGALQANVELTRLQLANLNTLLPETVRITGELGGELSWSGVLEETTAALELGGLSMALSSNDEWNDALTFMPSSINLAPEPSGDLRLEVRLPLADSVDNTGVFADAAVTPMAEQAPESWPLAAQLILELPDMSWLAGITDQLDTIDASLSGELTGRGTLGAPQLGGNALFQVPKLRIDELGVDLLDTTVELAAAEKNLALKGAMRSGEGAVELNGNVDWVDGLRVEASLAGEDFMVSDVHAARAAVSPDLQVRFENNKLKLRGEVVVPLADIRLAKVPEGAITASPDQRFLDDEEQETPTPLDFDARVRVRLGDDVRFSGLGLNAQFGGELTVSEQSIGTTTGKGEIVIREGTYKAYGQDLSVANGKLIFAGGSIDAPGLDIRAERQATPDVMVGVQVQGSLDAPRLDVFSTPSLPQSDQLSYLVLGRPLSASSASENSILQQAAFAIGVEGGSLLTERVGKNLGVDTFAIESEPGTGASQAALVVGKFLSPRLYVSYGYGLFQPISTLRMEYQLNRLLRVVTQSTNEATGGDLFWVKER